MRIGVQSLRGIAFAGCTGYGGPVTNAAPPAGSEGPPLLTGGYSP